MAELGLVGDGPNSFQVFLALPFFYSFQSISENTDGGLLSEGFRVHLDATPNTNLLDNNVTLPQLTVAKF